MEISSKVKHRGQRKSTIIIPEMDYNVGLDLTHLLSLSPQGNLHGCQNIQNGHAALASFSIENLQNTCSCCLVGTFNDPFQISSPNPTPSIAGSRKDASREDNNGNGFGTGEDYHLSGGLRNRDDNSKEELVANRGGLGFWHPTSRMA
ncbi:hypothetical protein H5410_023272 [Solanum commersonii]|uniref:Uncharacterized protein n=1 Tax=Solanum commersonii TaxID=4109 RepID=A0A9J5ZIR3_SOLCO|nr:hypothetical protein H5410_023272 [Solanum commersonii]